MAKMTRLATTVTARYFPSNDLTDAFYLDGRLTGKRESRSADITTDKEDRGFFQAIFSHATISGQDPNSLPPYEPALRKLYNDIKSGRKSLDDEIGEMVNTAVSVTGRLKIQAENARAPFFSGVIVKDSEAFAITLGKGLAFLYRDDTLFPMTATDIKIDPVNTQKQKVDHFYNYCATKTATALCSNIAQLRVDDCLILCNREVYDALGQHELLRILYEAEDQCEAAGNVITEAAAKLPNVPLQFMISFVENVSAPEKAGLFGFGRKKNQREPDEDTEAPVEENTIPVAAVPVAPTIAIPATDIPEPLAEKPVPEVGPQDPIQFNDENMKPFGEPPLKKEPDIDEGGFIKPGEAIPDAETVTVEIKKTEDLVDATVQKAATEVASELKEEARPGDKTSTADPDSKPEVFPSAEDTPKATEDSKTDHIADKEPEEDFAVMKAFAREDEWVVPVVSGESVSKTPKEIASVIEADGETESEMGNFDFDGKDTPRYIPDDEGEESEPLLFGDEREEELADEPGEEFDYSGEVGEYSDFSEDQIPVTDDGFYGSQSTAGQSDGYYIPFDSVPPPQPLRTADQAIPEIPIYDAPAYQPPTYFDERDGSAYQPAETYSRGSFDLEDDDRDIRRDYPPMPKSSSAMDFSYGMPPSPPASGVQPPRRNPPRPDGRGGPPQVPGRKARPGDPFDQERGYDYGEADRTFRKNNIWMIVLGAVCVVLIIVLIAFAVSECGNNKTKATTIATTETTAPQTETTLPSETTGGPVVTTPTNPGTEPIGIFEFSDDTGFRTWWDLFYTVYGIKIDKGNDPRIATIITYNQKPTDYVPLPGDQILLPPSSMLTTGS